MRFFKIFLVAFLSLVGSIGAIIGVMYLTGYFTKNIIEPEAIYFEYVDGETEYNLSNNSYIKILSTTEGVTVTSLTLSLPNQESDEENGVWYITDGIIKVPKYVNIGQAFMVELCTEADEEIDNEEWIVGGTSVLTAKSESLKASQISANINVDVPVKSVEVITYSNDTYSQPTAQFAAGETFYAKAEFLPKRSLYKFGQDGTNEKPVQMKSVYFDAISSGENASVELNETINAELEQNGITNVKAYNALTQTDDLALNAYAFVNSSLEQEYVENADGDAEQILADLKHSNVSTSGKKEVEIQTLVISSFTIASNMTQKNLEFNQVNKIFANYGTSSSALNFGIEIKDSSSSSPKLQSKIKNVGIEVYYKSGNSYVNATAGTTFLIVDNLNQVVTPTADGLYLPNVVEADVNKSYWNFVPLQSNHEFGFTLYVLNEDGTKTAVTPAQTFDANYGQVWKSSQIQESEISWTNSDEISLTVVDAVKKENVQSEEFDLSTILTFTPGTYSSVKYVAYIEGSEEDLSKLLPTVNPTDKYNTTDLGVSENTAIFELTTPILKLSPSTIKGFKVKAVVIITDFMGNVGTDKYTIYKSTPALVVNANKTVKELSASIEVQSADLLKNLNPECEDPIKAPEAGENTEGEEGLETLAETGALDKLAFVMGTNENIFDIVFTVRANTQEELNEEVAIFLKDFENGKILINARIMGEQQNVVTKAEGVQEPVSATEWRYRISYISGSANKDTSLWFEYVYQHTALSSYMQAIKNVTFNKADSGFTGVEFTEETDMALIEMYDGKVFDLQFKYQNTPTSAIEQRTEIIGTTKVENTNEKEVFYAETIDRKYYALNAEISGLTNEETGEFLVIAKDKFGNQLHNVTYNYIPANKKDPSGTETYTYYYLTTAEYSNALTSAPSDELYFTDNNVKTMVSTGVNRGTINVGQWTPDGIETGFTPISAQEAQNEIEITRYGVKNSVLQITGTQGLLSVEYAMQSTEDETLYSYFQLCNVLKYNFTSDLSVYTGLLEYNQDLGQLKILRTVGNEINLMISVTTDLGVSYSVKLVIKPNVTMQVELATNQGTLAKTAIFDSKQHFLVYSDNEIELVVKITFNLQEEITLILQKGVFSDDQTGTSQITFMPTGFTSSSSQLITELKVKINFTRAELLSQSVKIVTEGANINPFVFAEEMNFMVYPNASLVDGKTTLEKQITISNFANYYDVITNDDIERVIAGITDLTKDQLSISFSKQNGLDKVFVNNEDTPLSANIFVWDDQAKKIKCESTMQGVFDLNGEYTAYLTVKYGQELIGEVMVKISSCIAPNETAEEYKNRFVMYDGKMHFVLKSGEVITTEQIKALFNNVEVVEFTVDENLVKKNDETTFAVNSEIKSYISSIQSNRLTLKHVVQDAYSNEITIAEIVFPILLIPFDANFVTYKTAPDFEGKETGISNITDLNNYAKLYAYNVFDEYKSGENVCLFQLTGKLYGLSSVVFDAIKDSSVPYKILMEGPNGLISATEYQGTFNLTTGFLQTLPSSQDQFVYFVVYTDTNESNIIALYRMKIVANSAINVYYPYASGPFDNDNTKMAEYIYAESGEEVVIDLDAEFDKTLPNAGNKRVQLDVFNETYNRFEETTQNYVIEYSIYKVNNLLWENNAGTIMMTYGVSITDNVLTIANGGQEFDIVLKAVVTQSATTMGEAFYTIRLNSDQLSLYSLKLGTEDYTETSKVINKSYAQTYDYSQIKLYKTEGSVSSQDSSVALGVHYYIKNQDAQEFITEKDKQLSLNNNAVSNKNVVFNFYTIFGVVHTVNLTFISDYSISLSSMQSDVVLMGDAYEVYADVTISLKNVFEIRNSNGVVDITNVEFEYWDGDVFHTGDSLTFAQIANEKELHTIKAVAKFEDAGIATEDYEFTFFINVLQSVKSNFVETDFVLSATEIVYNQSYNTDGLVFDKLLKTTFLTDEEINAGTGGTGEGEGIEGTESGSEENTEPEEVFMFNSVSDAVLLDYMLIATISSNCAGFVSFDGINVLRKEMAYDEFILLKEDFKIYLLKSPGQDPLRVTITFEFSKDYGTFRSSVKANLTFVVVSDVVVTLNYPQANQETTLTQEYLYLENEYASDSTAKEFEFSAENGAYFGTTRVAISSKTGATVDLSRVEVVATSVDEYILIDGTNSVQKPYGENFAIKWKTQTSGIVTSQALFTILVDGVERDTYNIIFKNDINEIFAVQSLKNLYEDSSANTEGNPETFFVDKNSSELVFSHKTALLTFTSKSQTEPVTLIAYVQNDSATDKAELGIITLSGESKEIKWLLVNEKYEIKEDLSNVIVQVAGDTKTNYAFNIDSTNHVYTSFMYSDISLDYRLQMTYMGESLSYDNFKSILTIGTSGNVDNFKIIRTKEESLQLDFKIENAVLFTKYYYEVIFDFQASNAFATHKSTSIKTDASLTITAPSSISLDNETTLANEVFGISGVDGTKFNKEYFQNHKVKYNAQIVLVTKYDFETNPVQENVKYLPEDKVWFMNRYFAGINQATSVLCAAINPKYDEQNQVYDFNFQALGAENDGNFVYILITYSAQDTATGEITESNLEDYAYAIIKVFVKPNDNSIVLFNDANQTANSFEDESRYKITYKDDGTFDEITLGKNGDTYEDANLIYIFGANSGSLNATNLIASSDGQDPTALTLCGDIAKYAEISQIGGAYYLSQKGATLAIYGDKEGYIQIKDMYGYEKNFYLILKAQNADTAVSIVSQDDGGAFVNQIENTQNKYYTGTKMTIIDAKESYSFMDMGAIKLNNFQVLTDRVIASTSADVWKYQVSFAILELGFSYDNPEFTGTGEPIKTFVLPSIVEDSKNVTLYIYITITHNDIEEVVTLQTAITIEKRFKLTDTLDATSSVQSGISFDVAQYLSVKDEANASANLGGTSISDDVLTLKVKASAENLGKILTVNAIHNTDTTLNRTGAGIVVGKDFNDQEKTSTNGYFYYALVDHPVFDGINFANYAFSVVGTEIDASTECNLLADKIVYLTTSNVAENQKVYVQINNSEVSYAVPFNLSVNGIQAKSLAEVIEGQTLVTSLTHTQVTTNLPEIQTYGVSGVTITSTDSIYEFVLASTPVSAEDLQTIKNFKVYDASLKLKIEKINESIDLTQINFTVQILSVDDELLGAQTYTILESNSHYRYISVYDILGGNVDIAQQYKIKISYLLSQSNIQSIISYNGEEMSVGAKEDNMYPYTLTSTFVFTEILAGANEMIEALSANSFENKIYKSEKAYLVKYLNQEVYESKKLTFNVTPKYYAVNQGTNAHYIYANQFTVENGIYTVEFNTWASTFELISLSGEVLATLNNDSTLEFKINVGGAGSGSAKIDENNNIVTTENYNEDQSFVIEIWVPVADGSIHIGNVTIILSHSQVYVANPSTYMFIITYQNEGNTIDSSYNFVDHVTSIDDLVFNNPSQQLQELVNKTEKTIEIGGQARKISACNIQIVTVIEQIFSAEYMVKRVAVDENTTELKEFLRLKLKLNETSSSDGKTVELQVEAKSKITGIKASTTNLNLSISKKSGTDLEFDIKCGASTSERVSTGVYVVDIPFTNVYQNIIGEDFAYAAKVVSTASTNAELLYAKRIQEKTDFENGQTMFFALSFVDSEDKMHYTLLATKFDETNSQMFETDGYFTLNISTLPVIDGATVLTGTEGNYTSQVACYSIKFLGAYDMDLSASDLLISSKLDDKTTTYSVGKVTYSADAPYEISINGEEIYNQLISSSTSVTLSLYTPSNTTTLGGYNLPTVISLEASQLKYFGVYFNSIADMRIVAIEPTGTETIVDFVLDTAWFGEGIPFVTIMDMSSKLTGTNLADTTYWLQDSNAVVKTSSTKTQYTNHNQYVFAFNMLLNANSASQITQINLSNFVAGIEAGKYYHFTMQRTGDLVNTLYFAVQADTNSQIIVNPEDVFAGLFTEDARYVFALQNIVSSTMSNTLVYELYSNAGLVEIKAVSATQNGGLFVFTDNLLTGNATSAKQNTSGAYQISIVAGTMTYITTTKSGISTFDAVYLNENGTFDVDLSALAVGESLSIVATTTNFTGFNANSNAITLHLTIVDAERTFNIAYEGGNEEIVVSAGTAEVVIDKDDLGEIGTIDLTIQPI